MLPIEIRPRRIPGQESVPVVSHQIGPGGPERRITLMVDREAAELGPIVRGRGVPYIAVEGRRISDPALMRRSLPPVVGTRNSHLAVFERKFPGRRAIAVTGCGNLGMNPGVVARVDGQEFGVSGVFGMAMAMGKDGRGRVVEELGGLPEDWVISGPALVRGGRPALSSAESFADPRHLLLFPYLALEEGAPPEDFGQDLLLGDPQLYRTAVAGDEVALPLPDGSGEIIRKALHKKGYEERTDPGPGAFRVSSTHLHISFLAGIYPHHVLLLGPEGRLSSFLVSGASNRAGVRLAELAEDLARGGVEAALLLDNGGDVGVYEPAGERFLIRPAEPDRSALWPLTACLIHHDPL